MLRSYGLMIWGNIIAKYLTRGHINPVERIIFMQKTKWFPTQSQRRMSVVIIQLCASAPLWLVPANGRQTSVQEPQINLFSEFINPL